MFFGCVRLKSIKLPDSVKSIKEGAFIYCASLELLEYPIH